MTPTTELPQEIHQHSGWWLPLAVLGAVVLLSGLFLLYDLRPARLSSDDGNRTADPTPVALTVRGTRLLVPANMLDDAHDAGARGSLTLSVLLPDLRGWSAADAPLFAGNAPDSPVAHLIFKGGETDLDPAGRLQRIYMPYIADAGAAGPFGLTRYGFRADSGYARDDLFAGMEGGRLLLLLCERASPDLPSPNCLAIGRPVGPDLSFSYRFKRSYLGRWNEIAAGMDRLLARLRAG